MNETHSDNLQVLVWTEVGVELESDLDCHLARVLAWVHGGERVEGLQLGACTER